MINIFISVLLVLFSFQAFTFTYQATGIKKTILNMPVQIFENSIPLFQDEQQEFIAYFDQKVLQANVEKYLDQSLLRYCPNYEVEFFYYSTDDHLICRKPYCDGVEVNVSCSLIFAYTYEQTMFYEIKDMTRL